MIQKCPQCGHWCTAEKADLQDKVLHGIFGGGDYLLSPFRITCELLSGDRFYFFCPECNYGWEANEGEDQMAEYKKEQEELQRDKELEELREQSLKLTSYSNEEVLYFEDQLRSMSSDDDKEVRIACYNNILAYVKYKNGDKSGALQAINKSIQFCDAPNAHATKGVIMAMGEERTAHDKYKALQELVKYKEEDGIPYWATDGEMDKILEDQTFSFANAFLNIPYRQRKFIVISDQDYVMLPDNLKVVPNKYLPTEMQFTEGHPVVGEIYVCHPYHENFYLPIDSYQIELFRDELGEIRYLLQCLGAKSIEIEDKNCKEESSMKGNSMGGHVHGEYKGIGGGVSGSYSDEQDKFQKAINDCFVNQNFRRPKEKPHIPEGLVWYPHRKSWQDLVRQLELGNLDSHHVTISTSDCLQVSEKESSSLEIEVKALIAAGGIGGNYDTSTSFKSEANKSWTLKVDFYPNEEEEKQLVQQEPTHLLGVAKNKTGNKMKWLVYGLIALIIILGAIIAALLL